MEPAPLAHFITFRTYGTWLHGDVRGSFQAGAAPMPGVLGDMPELERARERALGGAPVHLDTGQRGVVADTIREVCRHHGWRLHAVSVRSAHVHVVVTLGLLVPPERAMTALKAWSTRRLVERGLRGRGTRVWSRHGSTVYVWTPRELESVCRYVDDQ